MRHILLIAFLLSGFFLRAQVIPLFGFVSDSATGAVIPYANVLVKGTVNGKVTDEKGSFFLKVDSLPVTLVVTCIGYRTTEVRVERSSSKTLTIVLAPSAQLMNEVVISAERLKLIQKDQSLMAVDFEFYDNYLLVLAHRDVRSPSRLMLLDATGANVSTLYVSHKMEYLYRDCFGEIHLQSNDSSWQVHYDYEKLQLLYPTTREKMETAFKGVDLFFGGRMYTRLVHFHGQRCNYLASAGGFTTCFHKSCDTVGVQRITTNYDINYFLMKRRRGEGYNYSTRYIKKNIDNFQAELQLAGKDAASLRPHNGPVVQHNNAVWIFDFTNNHALRFNNELRVTDTIPLDFHANRDYDWNGQLYRDEITDQLYTAYEWKGITHIYQLNDTTFQLQNDVVLANMPFPKELKIRNGVAYFLWLDRATEGANRMLYRYPL